MAREQEVCDTLLDRILMAAVSAHELSLGDLRLQEELVQVLQERLVALQLLRRGRLLRQLGEAKL